MKNKLFGTATIAAAMAFGLPAMAQSPIKIGFVSTFSGPQAAIGEDMRRSVELAKEHLGGKMGGKPFEIIYEDDQFKPDVGKARSEKLVQQDKVNFIGGYIWSNVLLASYKTVVDEGDTILISANAGPSQIAGDLCNKNFFSTSWQNDQTPMAMGEYLNTKGVKSLYLVGPNYAAGKDMLAGVKRTYKGKIVSEDYTKWPDQLDFSAEMTKIAAAKPDGIFIFYPGAHGVQFVKQWAQSGLNKTVPLYQVFSIDAITLPQQGDLALGTLGAQEWVNDLPNEANKKYVADFKKKHGTYPSYYGAQSYDAIMLMASAAEALKGDLSNKDKVRAEMKKANFKSVRGDFKFGNNNFPIENFYIQETVKDPQGMVTVKTIATAVKDAVDPFAAKCPMK
ncbi:MAG: ABC transporter substrate-binding protein [Rhodospirillales bacterium 24-66-33]|jgi:branched-chain amino acid transport system substrate-binding protein|uniref:ABC transporter substrate-binding protein n=2 Tax=Reyranella sp. TaxID=1929291 RepID=UPI000BCFF1A6|nr:MAG: ABC transporter substrate-binding protein [Rhodospirillales bacterium 35-66-84]OYZ94419.1 MAG: ABC transporter substrate-binding protein [Rhodospirillales bacterium 24-66-33]OZB25341.1 MAG: ABC transporter substrate-binding protein [Rhodospirillales bacterium 39-66-50]